MHDARKETFWFKKTNKCHLQMFTNNCYTPKLISYYISFIDVKQRFFSSLALLFQFYLQNTSLNEIDLDY